jgi:hypothetical protein
LHQFKAGIRNTWRSSIGDNGDAGAGLETGQQLRYARPGVVRVKADGSRRNAMVTQQSGRSPGVFDGDQIDLA